MPLFFFHLREGADVALDSDGAEMADMDAVRTAALRAARDTMSHDLRAGRLDLRYRIDVEDAAGTVVHSLPFGAAVEIIRP